MYREASQLEPIHLDCDSGIFSSNHYNSFPLLLENKETLAWSDKVFNWDGLEKRGLKIKASFWSLVKGYGICTRFLRNQTTLNMNLVLGMTSEDRSGSGRGGVVRFESLTRSNFVLAILPTWYIEIDSVISSTLSSSEYGTLQLMLYICIWGVSVVIKQSTVQLRDGRGTMTCFPNSVKAQISTYSSFS